MKRTATLGIALVLAALPACGADADSAAPASAPPQPQHTPVVTAEGADIGTAVTQPIGASGGSVESTGIKVTAPAGAFANANLTLQPIVDTLNGEGQGIAVSSDAAWAQDLEVTFPIDPSEPNPEALGLAVQQADGTWRAIAPVVIDVAAGTVSASLPAMTESAPSSAGARSRAKAGAVPNAPGKLNLKRVVKFKRFFLLPKAPTLQVNESVILVPYAQVVEKAPCGPGIPLPDCWESVTRPYAISNQLAGAQTSWFVDLTEGGSAALGTITPKSDTGATYVAPANAPSKGFVTVQFLGSIRFAGSELLVVAKAKVKIGGDKFPQQYDAVITVKAHDTDGNTFEGKQTLTLNKTGESESASGQLDGQGNAVSRIDAVYEVLARFHVINIYAGCQPIAIDITGRVELAMWGLDPTRDAPRIVHYWLTANQDDIVFGTAQCSAGPRAVQLVYPFQSQCDLTPSPDNYQQSAADLGLLAGKKTLACDNGLPITTWTGDWTLTARPADPPR